jgi:hypothetical protein
MSRHSCECGHPPAEHTAERGCDATNTTCAGNPTPCNCDRYRWAADDN